MYKVFSTFVDDVFAFLIESPLKYKLMTLRDDLVFCVFLVQAFLYRVDRSRANEFGYAYGEVVDGDLNGEGVTSSGDGGVVTDDGDDARSSAPIDKGEEVCVKIPPVELKIDDAGLSRKDSTIVTLTSSCSVQDEDSETKKEK